MSGVVVNNVLSRLFGPFTEWVDGDDRTVLYHRSGRVVRYRFETWEEHEDGTRTGVWMIAEEEA
jgi:hypothetical protein